ncbi:MAG: PEP-CTERM sorting domain-containing protein [Microcystis aeruginosa K13-06]|nr:PEP-CTERM sorting domain-containing protein [Microcystis aeruginosa K13-06]
MINTRLKPVTTGLIGAVGLGVALLGMPEMAEAIIIPRNPKYLFTPPNGNTFYTIAGLGTIPLKGNPLGGSFGQADTVLETLGNCDLVSQSSCVVDTVIRNLSLMSVDPVNIGGFNYRVDVSLNPNVTQGIGVMTINSIGTWDLSLPVSSVASFVPLDGGQPIADVLDTDTLTGTGTWASSPQGTAPSPASNNFCATGRIAGNNKQHGFVPIPSPSSTCRVPEPSAVLGLIAVGLSSIVGFKGKKEQK